MTMTDNKLTAEQITRAIQAWKDSVAIGDNSGPAAQLEYMAKYLQYQWQPPTPSEINELTDENMSNPPAGYRRAVGIAIQEFVARRNALLIPKPVDPRRELIISVISRGGASTKPLDGVGGLADAILEALDGAGWGR
jgi:hypothetical protein